MAATEMFMQNLHEFIYQEAKIVTYKWLSKALSVHINTAKQMLFAFVEEEEKKGKQLNIIYLLSGERTDKETKESMTTIMVVRESDLEKAKSGLDSITSVHIYSVQKSEIQDSEAIYLVDSEKHENYDISTMRQYSSIQCEAARHEAPPPETPEKIRPVFKSSSVKEGGQKKLTAAAAPSTSKAKANKRKGKVNGNASSFFARQNELMKAKKEAAANVSKKTEDDHPESEAKIDERNGKKDSEVKLSAGKKRDKEQKSGKIGGAAEEHSKKRRRIVQASFSSSSEDEDMEVNSKSPSPHPSEVVPAVLPSSDSEENEEVEEKNESEKKENGSRDVTDVAPNRKQRRKVLKARTFVDEDGFMVTEKVWESASESEADKAPEESPEKAKKETAVEPVEQVEKVESPKTKVNGKSKDGKDDGENNNKPKVAPKTEKGRKKVRKATAKGSEAGKANQPTLMSFFKKK